MIFKACGIIILPMSTRLTKKCDYLAPNCPRFLENKSQIKIDPWLINIQYVA